MAKGLFIVGEQVKVVKVVKMVMVNVFPQPIYKIGLRFWLLDFTMRYAQHAQSDGLD